MRYAMIAGLMSVSMNLGAFVEVPNEFFVKQDKEKRFFRVLDGERCLGVVVNSDYGQLDFYPRREEGGRWMNLFDHLYEGEKCLAWVKIASDEEWLQQSTLIEIYTGEGDLLAKMEAETGNCFVFRDAESGKSLAVALWKWTPAEMSWLSFLDTYVQEWDVMIVDNDRLREKNMPSGLLVWVLLKHAQKHLPNPDFLPYEDIYTDSSDSLDITFLN